MDELVADLVSATQIEQGRPAAACCAPRALPLDGIAPGGGAPAAGWSTG
jgi:hypothetical protein